MFSLLPTLTKRLTTCVSILLASAAVSFALFQSVPTQAATNDQPLTSSQANEQLQKAQKGSIDKAIDNITALPATLFPNCSNPPVGTTGTPKDIANAAQTNLIRCIRDILNIVFIIAVIFVVIDVSTSNLGIVLRSGEGDEVNPVKRTREKLEKAFIGLILIGGAALILNLFAGSLLNIDFRPLSNYSAKQFAVAIPKLVIDETTNQDPYYNNIASGEKRTDITLADKDITAGTNAGKVAKWVDTYLGSGKSVLSGSEYVSLSRSSAIPLKYLIAQARFASNYGYGITANTTCTAQKNNIFGVTYTDSELSSLPDLQKRIHTTGSTFCDYVKSYSSASSSGSAFASLYNSNYKNLDNCLRWEKLNARLSPNSCSTIESYSSTFEKTMNTQLGIKL